VNKDDNDDDDDDDLCYSRVEQFVMAYEASVVTQYSCRLSGDFPFVPFPYSLPDM